MKLQRLKLQEPYAGFENTQKDVPLRDQLSVDWWSLWDGEMLDKWSQGDKIGLLVWLTRGEGPPPPSL